MAKISSETMKRVDEIASLFGLPISTDVTTIPPSATLFELMEEAPSTSAPKRPKGLFEDLLRGDPSMLYQDMQRAPEKYDPLTVQLVKDIMTKRRELSAEERQLLDLAMLDYATEPPPKLPAPAKAATKKKEPEPEVESTPVEGVNFPQGLERPFWWLR